MSFLCFAPKVDSGQTGEPRPRRKFPPPPQSFYDTADRLKLLGEAGVEQEFVNKQGARLKSYFWPAPSATATLLYIHGHGSHILFELLNSIGPSQPPQYEGSWVQALNTAGVSVCGFDNQGCGRSEGIRFYVKSFEEVISDVVDFTKSLDGVTLPGFKGLPLFLGGCSLGGCITYKTMLREGKLYRGAVLLAPMLCLDRISRHGCNPVLLPMASLVSKCAPTAELAATTLKEIPFQELLAEVETDPLTMGTKRKTRVKNAVEYLRVCRESMAGMEVADFPFIVFQSENDTMCDIDGAKELFRRAKSQDKKIVLCNEMWHIVTKEPGNERILAETIEWIQARAVPQKGLASAS